MYTGAKIGSFIAIVLFSLFGLVPSLVYGGYMGLMMSTVLLGQVMTSGIAGQLIVAGGMGLGVAATLSLFLVLGALMGSGIHKLYGVLSGRLTSDSKGLAAFVP